MVRYAIAVVAIVVVLGVVAVSHFPADLGESAGSRRTTVLKTQTPVLTLARDAKMLRKTTPT
jgi:hypothetical protein